MTDNIYTIHRITLPDGTDRTDGRYSQRIGSMVKIANLVDGECMSWHYITDGDGKPKQGVMQTSRVADIDTIEDRGLLIVTTRNSVYYFKRVEQ